MVSTGSPATSFRRPWALVTRILIVLALVTGGTIDSATPAGTAGPSYVPGELLLKFRANTSPQARASSMTSLGAEARAVFGSGAEHWLLGNGVAVEQALEVLRADPNVEYAEPNYYVHATVVPNDPRFPELWGLRNIGQTGGTPGADIDAVMAWDISTGSPGVVVGDIDTGCDYNHPDLAANIWTNPGEIPGNGIDDDGNGFVDDVHGYDFANNDGDPYDDAGHGTHTAGTIAAVGGNGIGVVGVGWSTKIMCLKFLDASGSGTYAAATAAVDYATQMGVALTNNSWGGSGYSQTLYDAVARANAAGIAFVASAGNNGTDNDVMPFYPTNFDLANVISVAATDSSDAKASFSDWGATTVDLAAPGVDILSTVPGSSYGWSSGTSMAAPHVSGTLALMKAVAPGIPLDQMKIRLLGAVDLAPSMAGRCVSNGRLNAFLTIADPDDTPPAPITDLATVEPGSNTMGLTWTATGDDGAVGTASYVEVRYSTSPIDDSSWASATRAGNEPRPQAAGAPESMQVRSLAASTLYYFAMKAFDEWGNSSPISDVASGATLPPPTIGWTPAAIATTLYTGQTADPLLTVRNEGVGTLDFTVSTSWQRAAAAAPFVPLILQKGETDPRHGDPVAGGRGGPDAFGYRWVDGDEPGGPAFSWIDISATGTPIAISGDDQTSSPVPLGFRFPFYGNPFDSMRICTNGWISFTSSSASFGNQPLPSSGAPENLIAPFWDDLFVPSASSVRFQNIDNRAIVQWQQVQPLGGGGYFTFQAILEPSGAITFQYLSMTGAVNSATVGIQNATASVGLTVAFNQAYVHDGLAVRIAPIPQWLTVFPASGQLRAGESKAIDCSHRCRRSRGRRLPGADLPRFQRSGDAEGRGERGPSRRRGAGRRGDSPGARLRHRLPVGFQQPYPDGRQPRDRYPRGQQRILGSAADHPVAVVVPGASAWIPARHRDVDAHRRRTLVGVDHGPQQRCRASGARGARGRQRDPAAPDRRVAGSLQREPPHGREGRPHVDDREYRRQRSHGSARDRNRGRRRACPSRAGSRVGR